MFQVRLPPVSSSDGPFRSFGQDALFLFKIDPYLTSRTDAGRHCRIKNINKTLNVRFDIFPHQICSYKPHAAIYVVTDSSGRNYTTGFYISRNYSSNR